VKVSIAFDNDLLCLLPLKKRQPVITVEWKGKRPVIDLIQSLDVPRTEVGEILVNHKAVKFSYILQGGDWINVYSVPPLRHPPENPRFLCDVHLWKLARRLRLLGFDVKFNPQWEDEKLAEVSHNEKLILLTRDRGLLKRNRVYRGVLVRNMDPEKQVVEILKRLNAGSLIKPFSRCLICSHMLEPVDRESDFFNTVLKPQIPPKVLQSFMQFNYCPTCRKPFWKGSHHKKLTGLIETYRNL
jgi:uncharacterized protein